MQKSSSLQLELGNAEVGSPVTSNLDVEGDLSIEGNRAYASLLKQLSLDRSNTGGEGLKKYDSFSRWMSNELGEVDDSHLQSTSGVYWSTIEGESVGDVSSMSNQEQLDSYLVNPSISQEQLFSIVDFSPSWAYTGLETKVCDETRDFLNFVHLLVKDFPLNEDVMIMIQLRIDSLLFLVLPTRC